MEAAGIEPASRGTSVPASTCVARSCLWPTLRLPHVYFPRPQRAGFPGCYRPDFLAKAAAESNRLPGPRAFAILTYVQTIHFQAKGTDWPTGLTPRGRTAVQQLLCDRLFTRPTDQPRHATMHFRYPVDTRSPPELPVLSHGLRTICGGLGVEQVERFKPLLPKPLSNVTPSRCQGVVG